MSKKQGHIIRFILLLLLLNPIGWTMFGCGGVGSGSGMTTSTGEGLESTESGLYESGPAEIPVTIAKLEAIDPSLITIEIVKQGEYSITIAAGATDYPYVYFYNLDQGIEKVVTSDNLPLTTSIQADAGDQVAAAAAETSDPTEVGIPVYMSYEDGVTSVTITNSSSISPSSNFVTYDNGLLVTNNNSDGTYDILSIGQSDSFATTIVDSLEDIVYSVSLRHDGSGDMQTVLIDGQIFVNKSNGDGTWRDPELFLDMAMDMPYRNTSSRKGLNTFFASDGGAFICRTIWFDNTSTPDANTTYLKYTDSSQTTSDLITDATFRVADCYAEPDTDLLYVFVTPTSGGGSFPTIFALDMAEGSNAFAKADTVYTHAITDYPRSFHVSTPGARYFLMNLDKNGTDIHYMIVYDSTTDVTTKIYDEETQGGGVFYDHALITPDKYVVTCNHAEFTVDTTDDNFLLLHRFETDPQDTFYYLVGGAEFNPCFYDFYADEENRLYYYTMYADISNPPDDTSEQIEMIDLDNINFDDLIEY